MPDALDRLFDLERLRRNWMLSQEATERAAKPGTVFSSSRQVFQELQLLVQSEVGAPSQTIGPLWEQIDRLLLQQEQTPMSAKELAAHRTQLRQALQDLEEMLDALLLFQTKTSEE